MTYGAYTTAAPAVMDAASPGVVAYPNMPAEIKDFEVETAAVGLGIMVSRGTDKGKQCVAGSANPLGFTCRLGDLFGAGGEGNAASVPVGSSVSVMRSGYLWLQLKSGDTGDPDTVVNVVTATGVVGLGAAGGGEQELDGIQLDEVVTGTRTLARFRLDNPRIKVNPITGIKLNTGTTHSPTAGVVDLALVESIKANANPALVGAVVLADGSGIDLSQNSQTISVATGT